MSAFFFYILFFSVVFVHFLRWHRMATLDLSRPDQTHHKSQLTLENPLEAMIFDTGNDTPALQSSTGLEWAVTQIPLAVPWLNLDLLQNKCR